MASEFNIIIVGGGTAGCVLASRLAQDPARRVLMLEAGCRNERRTSVRRPAEYLRLQGTEVDWAYQTQGVLGTRRPIDRVPARPIVGRVERDQRHDLSYRTAR